MTNTKYASPFFSSVKFFCIIGILSCSIFSHAQNWNEVIKRGASNRQVEDWFGYDVAISDDYAIVGAHYEDEDANGASFKRNAGSAYIFKLSAGVWVQQQKIVATDRAADNRFGYSVAIDGEYVIVGAEGESSSAGAAYIFKRTGTTWTQQQKIVAADRAADDQFGRSVSISGEYAIVGAESEDHDASGGNTESLAGSAYIFKRTGTTWTQQQKIVAADRGRYDYFGAAVAISGDHALVGAHYEDHDANGTNFVANAGSVYTFKQTNGVWSQQQKIVASDAGAQDVFGYSLAISGEYAIVGAEGENNDAGGDNYRTDAGAAYIFKQTAGVWSEQQKIVPSDREKYDYFGVSVAINGNFAIVGAYWEDENTTGSDSLSSAGSAYIFQQTNGVWNQQQKIAASDRAADDQFGKSVAISSNYALVGAHKDDVTNSGGTTLTDAGSVYFFEKVSCISSSPVALVRDSTYTSSFTESVSGWTNFCTDNGELLLSLDTAGSGAVISATQVQVKTGAMNTYSYGTDGGLIDNVSGYMLMDRLWNVNPTTQPSTGDVGVRFYFSNAEYNSLVVAAAGHVNSMALASPTTITAPTDLQFYKATTGAAFSYPHNVMMGKILYEGSNTSVNTWTYAAKGADHSAEFRVSSFSGGGGGVGADDAVLPVTLLDFHGEWLNASTANLFWRTASEINNSHFELERSLDGQHWQHIARLESKAPNGNAHHIVNYAQLDTDMPATQPYFYYRLVQHDFDGAIEIHTPIVLRRERGGVRSTLETILLYPNPFRGELTVVHAVEEEDVRIEIADALGRVVYAADRVAPQQTIALDHLPAGLYHATITSANARQVHKIIKH